MQTCDSALEANPSIQPEIVMDLNTFDAEVNQEDYQHFQLPVTYIQDKWDHQCMLTHGDSEMEPLLFPVLYSWGRGH